MKALTMEERKEVIQILRALAALARTTVRPSNAPDVCRSLLDIEGIAAAEARKLERTES